MASRKYIVIDVDFEEGGTAWMQFALPKEKSLYKKELKWLKSQKKEIKWSSRTYKEEEVVILSKDGEWQPLEWRNAWSAVIE